MKDVATIEELAEIRDAIEFCENMVETLTEEMTTLKSRIIVFNKICSHLYLIINLPVQQAVTTLIL